VAARAVPVAAAAPQGKPMAAGGAGDSERRIPATKGRSGGGGASGGGGDRDDKLTLADIQIAINATTALLESADTAKRAEYNDTLKQLRTQAFEFAQQALLRSKRPRGESDDDVDTWARVQHPRQRRAEREGGGRRGVDWHRTGSRPPVDWQSAASLRPRSLAADGV